MSKIVPNKPLLIMLYGFPGSGKTYFARQFCETFSAAHLHGDRIRHELFEQPRYDRQENEIVERIMEFMCEEFLKSGVSVVYDTNAMRLSQRRNLREVARRARAQHTLIWLQIDPDSAFARTTMRDHRKAEDKYATTVDQAGFEALMHGMQNPQQEDYIVISGKHTFNTQKSAVIKKLYDIGVVDSGSATTKVVKPGLVNLIPAKPGGRVDQTRRNIFIR